MPGELVVGVYLEVLELEEQGEGLVDGVVDVKAASVYDLVVYCVHDGISGVRRRICIVTMEWPTLD